MVLENACEMVIDVVVDSAAETMFMFINIECLQFFSPNYLYDIVECR